jgi:hypothetical protein
MNLARGFHTATLLHDGRVLLAAGRDSNTHQLAAAEIFDPATGMWTTNVGLNAIRAGHTANLLRDGQVLVAGGSSSGEGQPSVILASAEIFAPTTVTGHLRMDCIRPVRLTLLRCYLTAGCLLRAGMPAAASHSQAQRYLIRRKEVGRLPVTCPSGARIIPPPCLPL